MTQCHPPPPGMQVNLKTCFKSIYLLEDLNTAELKMHEPNQTIYIIAGLHSEKM